ncbi:MAG TPA: hypothetical protein VNK94_00560 [Gaiellaceae bacterium]|nr:hypothetical protein [Gaiellaceae bacterium]
MIATVVAAFALFDQWWLRLLLLGAALAIGWYSLGLYARAVSLSAYRVTRGIGTDEDFEELGRLGEAAARQAIREVADAPDPQRDRLFGDFVNRAGGLDAAQAMVIEHMAHHGFDIDEEAAYELLDRWRKYGIVRNESLGEYLDETAQRSQPSE